MKFFKKPMTASSNKHNKHEDSDEINPYLAARRTWNGHVAGIISQRQTWQAIGCFSLLIALAAVGGIIHIGSQSKFIPYVIEVDKLGQAVAMGPVTATSNVDERVIRATLAEFIKNARMVTVDVALQRDAIYKVYSHLRAEEPAIQKMNEWLNGNPESNPFERASKEIVSIEIKSIMRLSNSTWQIDWEETTRDTTGIINTPIRLWRAVVTIAVVPPGAKLSEKQLQRNPMGIYVKDFSWARL